jgi:pyruvate kinase
LNLKRKTKIICTLGPAVDSDEKVRELMLNGMDIARFNFAHQTQEEHQKSFEKVCRIEKELGLNVLKMMDTKGPKIRFEVFENGEIALKETQKFIITTKSVIGNEKIAAVNYKGFANDLKCGDLVYIDDGLLQLKVVEVAEEVVCVVIRGGVVSNKKGINLPNVNISASSITQEDEKDIQFGMKLGFDYVSASFTKNKADIVKLRDLCEDSQMQIIAKIENREGINNVKEILEVSDGVVVARGDMGVEIPFEELPSVQKEIVSLAFKMKKPAVVATQMLDSMIWNLLPTRAESTDVANAVFDGAAAVMLAAETAIGKHPIETLCVMRRLLERAEQDIGKFGRMANIAST